MTINISLLNVHFSLHLCRNCSIFHNITLSVSCSKNTLWQKGIILFYSVFHVKHQKKKDRLWPAAGRPKITPSWLRLEGNNHYSFNLRVDYILWNTALNLKNESFQNVPQWLFLHLISIKKKKKITFITFPKSCKRGRLNYRKPL